MNKTKEVHFWDGFAPEENITFTQCGRMVPYNDSGNIVSWAEKDATCADCLEIAAGLGAGANGIALGSL